MASPQIEAAAASTRSEQDVRELARAKVRAQAAWTAFCHRNRNGLSEDELIDLEIESKHLCKALNDADRALHNAAVSV